MKFLYKDLIKNNSRRRFLTIISIGTLSYIGILSFTSSSKKISKQEDLILVNGWVLKKKDLDVI